MGGQGPPAQRLSVWLLRKGMLIPWTSHLISMEFHFLLCKMNTRIVPASPSDYSKEKVLGLPPGNLKVLKMLGGGIIVGFVVGMVISAIISQMFLAPL